MIAQQLINWCKDLFERDSAGGQLTDSQWIMHFNAGLIEVAPFMWKEKVSYSDIIAGEQRYALPTDLQRVVDVGFSGRGKHTFGGYEYFANEIRLSVAPQANIDDGLALKYLAKPNPVVATTDVVDCPDPYVIGYYALVAATQGDEEMNYSGIWKAEYLQRRDAMSMQKSYRQTRVKNSMGW